MFKNLKYCRNPFFACERGASLQHWGSENRLLLELFVIKTFYWAVYFSFFKGTLCLDNLAYSVFRKFISFFMFSSRYSIIVICYEFFPFSFVLIVLDHLYKLESLCFTYWFSNLVSNVMIFTNSVSEKVTNHCLEIKKICKFIFDKILRLKYLPYKNYWWVTKSGSGLKLLHKCNHKFAIWDSNEAQFWMVFI